jgi:hypothetical protein
MRILLKILNDESLQLHQGLDLIIPRENYTPQSSDWALPRIIEGVNREVYLEEKHHLNL